MMETIKLIKKNILLFITAITVDTAFFIAYGFYTAPVSEKITAYASIITSRLAIIMAEKPTGLLKHLFDAEIKPYTINLAMLVLIFFIITYALYTIFQGTGWWITTQIAKKQYKYHKYFIGFAKINIYYFAGYVLYKIINIIISIRYAMIQKVAEATPNIAGKILFAAALFLGITAFFSYPTLKMGTIFRIKFKKTITILLMAAALYIATEAAIKGIGKINTTAALITGAILLFSALNYIKTYTNVHTRT